MIIICTSNTSTIISHTCVYIYIYIMMIMINIIIILINIIINIVILLRLLLLLLLLLIVIIIISGGRGRSRAEAGNKTTVKTKAHDLSFDDETTHKCRSSFTCQGARPRLLPDQTIIQ